MSGEGKLKYPLVDLSGLKLLANKDENIQLHRRENVLFFVSNAWNLSGGESLCTNKR